MVSQYLHQRSARMIPFKNLAQETRDNLDIYKQIAAFLQPKPIKRFISSGLATESV